MDTCVKKIPSIICVENKHLQYGRKEQIYTCMKRRVARVHYKGKE